MKSPVWQVQDREFKRWKRDFPTNMDETNPGICMCATNEDLVFTDAHALFFQQETGWLWPGPSQRTFPEFYVPARTVVELNPLQVVESEITATASEQSVNNLKYLKDFGPKAKARTWS